MPEETALSPESEAPGGGDGSADDGYRVRIPVFEGPMDLLLHLIKINEIDITDIPILQVTRQYIEYLDLMQELNLDVAGEFLVMAATLVHIKSQVLLPRPEEPDEEDLEDPRRRLMEQLLFYERFRKAGEDLREQLEAGQQMWMRGGLYDDLQEMDEYEFKVTLFDLITAFKGLLARSEQTDVHSVVTEEFSIRDKMDHILFGLEGKGKLRFDRLFADCQSRTEMIVLFLALLELIRLNRVQALQHYPLAPIWIRPGTGDG
ncbi:segregation/condensation protein A [bacterium]|nr:segregation/condensation protein A [candidate division CSSED10-310 bacterium]